MEHSGIRNELARERTALANERTLLAYGRTAVGVAAIGLFVFKFAPEPLNLLVGSAVTAGALFVWLFGIRRFRAVSEKINPTLTVDGDEVVAVETLPIKHK